VIPLVLALGAVAGLITAFPVAQLGIPSFVASLAGWLIYRGFLQQVTEGTGTIIKLAHNLVRRSIGLAIGEGMVLGAKAGVDPELLWQCMHWGLDSQLQQLGKALDRSYSAPMWEEGSRGLLAVVEDSGRSHLYRVPVDGPAVALTR